MFSLSGHHLGDTWTQSTGDRVHMFFLFCPDTTKRHTQWSIGHASSTDLLTWKRHADVLHSDPAKARYSCLATGSVIRWKGRHLMSVIGNHNSPDPRTLFLESEDLETWRELEGVGFGIDGNVYTGRGSGPFTNPRWRDPFLFQEGDWLYCLMTAAVAERSSAEDGVVGVMRTRDLKSWEVRPPLQIPLMGTDLECPKLYRIGGQYHLLISMFNVLQSPQFAALQPQELNPSTTFSLVSSTLDGPYRFAGNGRTLVKDAPGFPYACEAVSWKGSWYLLGTCWSDRRGDSISDPIPLSVSPEGFRGNVIMPQQGDAAPDAPG